MKYETWITLVQEGIEKTIKSTDSLEISGFAKRIHSADRIFLYGSWRHLGRRRGYRRVLL